MRDTCELSLVGFWRRQRRSGFSGEATAGIAWKSTGWSARMKRKAADVIGGSRRRGEGEEEERV